MGFGDITPLNLIKSIHFIDALPSFVYPLGQLVFLILVYRLLVHQYIKRFLTMYLSIYVIGIKKRFKKVNYLC